MLILCQGSCPGQQGPLLHQVAYGISKTRTFDDLEELLAHSGVYLLSRHRGRLMRLANRRSLGHQSHPLRPWLLVWWPESLPGWQRRMQWGRAGQARLRACGNGWSRARAWRRWQSGGGNRSLQHRCSSYTLAASAVLYVLTQSSW